MPAPRIQRPFAEQGDTTVVPQVDPNGFINFTEGYTRSYEISIASGDTQAKAVERRGQNWMFNALTSGLQDFQQYAVPPFYADMTGGYSKNAQVIMGDGTGGVNIWRALRNGVVTVPGAVPTDWERQQATGELLTNVPSRVGGTGGPAAASITAAIDFNTFTAAGTWALRSSVASNASTNGPRFPGQATTEPGVLEVLTFALGSGIGAYQRYQGMSGRTYARTYWGDQSTWTTWFAVAATSDVQFGALNYADDTSTVVNRVSCAFVPALTQRLRTPVVVTIKNTNTGAVSFNDGVGDTTITGSAGSPCTGGELIAGRRVVLLFDNAVGGYMIVATTGATQLNSLSYLNANPPFRDWTNRIATTNYIQNNSMNYGNELADANLNDRTGRGFYPKSTNTVPPSPALNYPIAELGVLCVQNVGQSQAENVSLMQTYTTLSARTFLRRLNANVWSAWTELATVPYVDNVIGNYAGHVGFNVNTQLTTAHAGRVIRYVGAPAGVFTMPPIDAADSKSGQTFTILNHNNLPLTINAGTTGLFSVGASGRPGPLFSTFTIGAAQSIVISNQDKSRWLIIDGTAMPQFEPATSPRCGEFVWWGYNGNFPANTMKANGANVSRTTYAALFAKIGTTYGNGDGTTTFGLPDLRGMHIRGLDEGRGLDGGRLMASQQSPALMSHYHGGATNITGNHTHAGVTADGGEHAHNLDYNTPQQSAFPYQSGILNSIFHIGIAVTPNTRPAGTHAHNFGTYGNGDHQHFFNTDPAGIAETRVWNLALIPLIFF